MEVRVAPGGASLGLDDIAREINHDRGEGSAQCPAGDLQNGGGGDSERVVPGHSGRDSAGKVVRCGIRIKGE